MAAREWLEAIRQAREDEPAAVAYAVAAGLGKQQIADLLGRNRETVRVKRKQAEEAGKARGTAGQGGDSPIPVPAGDDGETGESRGAGGPRKQAGEESSPGTRTTSLPGSEPH